MSSNFYSFSILIISFYLVFSTLLFNKISHFLSTDSGDLFKWTSSEIIWLEILLVWVEHLLGEVFSSDKFLNKNYNF